MESLTTRIEAGAAYLDTVYGRQVWRKKVDLQTLYLGSMTSCILGQTDTDFKSHRIKLNLSSAKAVEMGFDIAVMTPGSSAAERYKELTEAWKKYLRLDGDAVQGV